MNSYFIDYEHFHRQARELGFHKAGVAPVGPLPHQEFYQTWLENGFHGEMTYMARFAALKEDVQRILPEAKSVFMVFVNYYQPDEQAPNLVGRIARYAWGRDYHLVLKDPLYQLALELHQPVLETTGEKASRWFRVFVDSGPLLEKLWAVAAGLGWQGKHSNLITREYGSWGVLGAIVSRLPCDRYDEPITPRCGTCTACIDACPTDAIVEPYVVDARRCISYATIEIPGAKPLPTFFQDKLAGWIFGCDICQEVCPWNRFQRPTDWEDFSPLPVWRKLPDLDFSRLSPEEFEQQFAESPLSRPGLAGLRLNQQ